MIHVDIQLQQQKSFTVGSQHFLLLSELCVIFVLFLIVGLPAGEQWAVVLVFGHFTPPAFCGRRVILFFYMFVMGHT